MKRGQLKISFGMIFSIILIIIFVSFAFYAIKLFLDTSDDMKVGKFFDDIQKDVDKAWRSHESSQEESYALPPKIELVCFADFDSNSKGADKSKLDKLEKAFWGSENLIFYPVGSGDGLDSKNVLHIDLEQTTQTSNPLCLQNVDGKVKMTIKKDFGEKLVTITD